MVRDVRSEQPLIVAHSTWFETITHPRRHLIFTLCVWTWFVVALVGDDFLPPLAPALDATAAVAVSTWYVAMITSYRRRSPKQPIDQCGVTREATGGASVRSVRPRPHAGAIHRRQGGGPPEADHSRTSAH